MGSSSVPVMRAAGWRWALPNLTTLLGLGTGLTSVRFAMAGDFHRSLLMIVLATFIDALDGKIARVLKATSHFGAELDSLSDFVCFGASPAFVLYIFTLSELGIYGWYIVLWLCACAAYRLARFNTTELSPGEFDQVVPEGFFTGVPAPAAAVLTLFPMIVKLELAHFLPFVTPQLCAVNGFVVGLLMVSRLPTPSIKHIRFDFKLSALMLVSFSSFALFPYETTCVVCFLYLLLLPVCFYKAYYAPGSKSRCPKSH
eukprot:ANDGO_05951.mRNA.1 CDP-diacylglycerol--serine O-phosphatidyltransferase